MALLGPCCAVLRRPLLPSWPPISCRRVPPAFQCNLLRYAPGACPRNHPPCPTTRSDLSGNELRGRLPGRWARLDSLERLRLDANALTGPLPAWWNTMESIQHL